MVRRHWGSNPPDCRDIFLSLRKMEAGVTHPYDCPVCQAQKRPEREPEKELEQEAKKDG